MSSQSTKERKAKENLVVLHNCSTYDTKFEGCYVESIRGGMCQAIHPFIIYYELECLLSKSKDYYKPIKTNKKKANSGNYIQYKSNGDKEKNLLLKEYLNMIKSYSSDIINDHKKWKIQLTMRINFISIKDLRETHPIHTKSDKIKIMMGSKTNDITEELFKDQKN